MFLRNLFSKFRKKEKNEDIVMFARAIERRIDKICLDIFKDYKSVLLKEPNIYIVPALWGATKDGELTPIQKEIHLMVAPVIQEILESLYVENMSPSQEFTMGYLVRGFFISKIIYMIEFYKNMSFNNQTDVNNNNNLFDLKDIEPLGHA